jgi:cytochrome c oxidase accessory protein FixG
VLSIFIGIFLFTALFGRVWCGWACPQTVWLEFLFRPIERWTEGGPSGSRRLDTLGARGQLHPRRLAKYGIYLLIAVVLAHTNLAYFVGVDRLRAWVQLSPAEHPMPFAVMAITTGLIMFNFAYFREQTCLVACPYGRLQSALLDRQSLIVTYDLHRGEPRGHDTGRTGLGDCIDCKACVTTCPTGIDIRDGLQLECVHCTQCIDACDTIMEKVGKPPGLIRYSSQEALEGKPYALVRVRTVLYPAAMLITGGLLVWQLLHRVDAEVTLLRGGQAAPFVEEAGGLIANQVKVKVENRAGTTRDFTLRLTAPADAQFIAPQNPVQVAPGEQGTTMVFVLVPKARFARAGQLPMVLEVTDGASFTTVLDYDLLGPR